MYYKNRATITTEGNCDRTKSLILVIYKLDWEKTKNNMELDVKGKKDLIIRYLTEGSQEDVELFYDLLDDNADVEFKSLLLIWGLIQESIYFLNNKDDIELTKWTKKRLLGRKSIKQHNNLSDENLSDEENRLIEKIFNDKNYFLIYEKISNDSLTRNEKIDLVNKCCAGHPKKIDIMILLYLYHKDTEIQELIKEAEGIDSAIKDVLQQKVKKGWPPRCHQSQMM